MDMLRHDHVAGDEETVALAGLFQGAFKDLARLGVDQARLSAVTTEGDEVEVAGLVKALQSPGQGRKCTLVREGIESEKRGRGAGARPRARATAKSKAPPKRKEAKLEWATSGWRILHEQWRVLHIGERDEHLD